MRKSRKILRKLGAGPLRRRTLEPTRFLDSESGSTAAHAVKRGVKPWMQTEKSERNRTPEPSTGFNRPTKLATFVLRWSSSLVSKSYSPPLPEGRYSPYSGGVIVQLRHSRSAGVLTEPRSSVALAVAP